MITNPNFDSLKLKDSGFCISRKFINSEILDKINLELNELFNSFLLNGYNRGSIILNNLYNRQAITTPCININSINIMELIIDVYNLVIEEEKKKDYVVSNVMIFSEMGNPDPLKFHTDLRKDMCRAQIYLKGGKINSGGFRYIRESNTISHNTKHELSKEDLKKYEDKIVDLSGSEGDLVVFDPYGFHGKHPCIEERRTIMFEFQPKHTDYPKSQIDFNGALLTKKVLSNIEIFIHNYKKNDHYLDDYKNNYVLNFRILFKSIVSSLKLVFRKKKSEFFLKVRKKLSKYTD